MKHDLDSKFDSRMNASRDNVKCNLYDNPNYTIEEQKEWAYAIIVEVEDDQKTARLSLITNNGEEMGCFVSHIHGPKQVEEKIRINPKYDLTELVDELRKRFPENLRI